MTKSYRKILREVGDAVDHVRAEGGVVPWDAVARQVEYGRQLADLPDEATLEAWCDNELPLAPPNVVRAASLKEFALVYRALGHVHSVIIDQDKIDTDIVHERAHKLRADFIGFRYSGLALRVTESLTQEVSPPQRHSYEIRFSWRPFSEQAGPLGRVTKLAIASMVAAPYRLSGGDKARLNAMGYEGSEDVARRITTATDPRLSSLPLPEVLGSS